MPEINIQKSDKIILVDHEDLEIVGQHKWYFHNHGYATTFVNSRNVLIHRLLFGLKAGDKRKVDHINGDPLDNRRENLRVCTQAENTRNRKRHHNSKTGFKGVYISGSRFYYLITHNKKQTWKFGFSDAASAARAYDKAARELHGEFARLNFPDEAA